MEKPSKSKSKSDLILTNCCRKMHLWSCIAACCAYLFVKRFIGTMTVIWSKYVSDLRSTKYLRSAIVWKSEDGKFHPFPMAFWVGRAWETFTVCTLENFVGRNDSEKNAKLKRTGVTRQAFQKRRPGPETCTARQRQQMQGDQAGWQRFCFVRKELQLKLLQRQLKQLMKVEVYLKKINNLFGKYFTKKFCLKKITEF